MTFPGKDTIATYGGLLQDLYPVTDPTTDRAAAGANQAYGSVAAMTRTAAQAWARITTAASTAGLVLVAHNAAWGSGPLVAPTLTRSSTGVFTIAWPTTITDETSVQQAVSLLAIDSVVVEGTVPYLVTARVLTASIAELRVFTPAGALTDAAGTTIMVAVK